jgi:hypothetical protein
LIVDHHTGVERRVTDSACRQAWNAVNLGLVDTFTRGSEYHPRIVTRDCDQDVTLANHIIARAEFVGTLDNNAFDRVRRLVNAEDTMDRFGGVPPGRITPRMRRILERIAWIFDAYTDLKGSGELYNHDPEQYHGVMWEGSTRISQHAAGWGRSRQLDTRYQTVERAESVHIVERIGAEALLGAASDGLHATVLWQLRPSGRHQYTFFRRSELVPFNLPELYRVLNEAEGCAPGEGYGGSDTIGGSPLMDGSTIGPDALARILRDNPQIRTHPTPAPEA